MSRLSDTESSLLNFKWVIFDPSWPIFNLDVIFSSSMFKTQIKNSRVGKKWTGHIWPLNDRLQTKMRSEWIWIVWKHFTIEQMNFTSHWNRKNVFFQRSIHFIERTIIFHRIYFYKVDWQAKAGWKMKLFW